jgi:hypothetical protein
VRETPLDAEERKGRGYSTALTFFFISCILAASDPVLRDPKTVSLPSAWRPVLSLGVR